jgi:Mg2+ and Co2+ transporter CorA
MSMLSTLFFLLTFVFSFYSGVEFERGSNYWDLFFFGGLVSLVIAVVFIVSWTSRWHRQQSAIVEKILEKQTK